MSASLIKKWKLALVVLTVDHFLHIFDLPPEVGTGEVSKENAFKAIMPNPIDNKGRFKKSKDAGAFMNHGKGASSCNLD